MTHKTKQASGKDKHHDHGEKEIVVADDEIEEIDIIQQYTFNDRVIHVMEKFASTRMGQFMIERTDRVLKVVEDTAKWSLPQGDDSNIQLERPLPWLLFLSLIVWLRVFRIWLSVCAYIFGSEPITPYSMVYYVQTKRRRLRAIRVQGLKSNKSREIKTTVLSSSNKNISFIGKLRKLFGNAICKPGQHREVPARRVFVQDGKNAKDSSERSTKRPRDEDSIDLNLTVHEMLEKYANEDSDNDSDYIPKEDDENDGSSTSHLSSSSAEETEKESPEKPAKPQKDTGNTQKQTQSEKPEKDEIRENGGLDYQSKPKHFEEKKPDTFNAADRNSEQMHTPREFHDTNGDLESKRANEKSVAAAEVGPQTGPNTPKTALSYLAAPQVEEKKSTPGHESAAALKASVLTAAKTVPFTPSQEKKSYRTITTQTAIELDWTITIKTEITHTKHSPKLEKLNCSIDLSPASSTEDIFYSPIGSPQDLFSIFHPAPIVKGATDEVQTSTPKEADQNQSSGSDTTDMSATGNQKKYLNHPIHNKHNYHHHNAKNRNKNWR